MDFKNILNWNLFRVKIIVKLQSSLTVQSKSVGLEVDFVFPPSQVTNK